MARHVGRGVAHQALGRRLVMIEMKVERFGPLLLVALLEGLEYLLDRVLVCLLVQPGHLMRDSSEVVRGHQRSSEFGGRRITHAQYSAHRTQGHSTAIRGRAQYSARELAPRRPPLEAVSLAPRF